ncbi:MAG: amidohydrolase [Chitinophagaceae bacterium]|nr:MAG: amidohydrolase [Chitinophagaceae bacterium]
MTIDSHVHFWKYNKKRDTWITNDMKTLKEDYLPHSLEPTLRRNGMNGCVAVQADQSEVETEFYVELAKTYPFIKGVVGWTDLRSDKVSERLEYFSQYPVIKGWRHVVQGEPSGFLDDANFRRGVDALLPFNYSYDILIYHHQLPGAINFVDAFPGQRFVIDHCAKPDIRSKELAEWQKNIEVIAQNPDVYCKLSGLFTEAAWKQWSPADFYPYLDVVFRAFGTDRLMFGSDWPVMLLSGIYVQWKSLIEKYMETFLDEDKEKVFGLNAIHFYNL